MPPLSQGILESSLYVDDVARSVAFYKTILGFDVMVDFGERGCALRASPTQVLLLFRKRGSLSIASPHDGDGQLHLAFAIPAASLPAWQAWLAANSVPIEESTTWPRGGRSLYFRDPDRHLLELATPGVWPNY